MKILTDYTFIDSDVREVRDDNGNNQVELVFETHEVGALILHKKDVIKLANYFDLVVYHKNSNLR